MCDSSCVGWGELIGLGDSRSSRRGKGHCGCRSRSSSIGTCGCGCRGIGYGRCRCRGRSVCIGGGGSCNPYIGLFCANIWFMQFMSRAKRFNFCVNSFWGCSLFIGLYSFAGAC